MTDAERIMSIKTKAYVLITLADDVGAGKANLQTIHNDMFWLIEQAERAQRMEMMYENTGSIMNRRHQINRIEELEEENKRLRQQPQPTIDEIKVTKWKKGRPTVIDWNGERWVLDTQTTFRGGKQNGKQN